MTYAELTRLLDECRGVESYLNANLRRSGINFDTAMMLVSIHQRGGGPVFVGSIDYYGTNRSYGLSKLAELAYVVMADDKMDKRRKLVSLTKDGETLVKRLLELLDVLELKDNFNVVKMRA